MPRTCPTSETIGYLIADALENFQKQQVLEHVQNCDLCKREIEEYMKVVYLLHTADGGGRGSSEINYERAVQKWEEARQFGFKGPLPAEEKAAKSPIKIELPPSPPRMYWLRNTSIGLLTVAVCIFCSGLAFPSQTGPVRKGTEAEKALWDKHQRIGTALGAVLSVSLMLGVIGGFIYLHYSGNLNSKRDAFQQMLLNKEQYDKGFLTQKDMWKLQTPLLTRWSSWKPWPDHMERLKQLFDAGIISKADYQKTKDDLISLTIQTTGGTPPETKKARPPKKTGRDDSAQA